MELIIFLIVFFNSINLFRITSFLIGSDVYNLKYHIKFRQSQTLKYPKISVVIPAFNEEHSILRSIKSVLASDYPKDKLEVIVVDDGSTDSTYMKVKKFIASHNISSVKLVTQVNSGKAHALNKGLREYAKGALVMCLDADSLLSKSAIMNSIKYFEDEKVMAVATNVKIIKGRGYLNLVQQMEYLVSYQMKRALTLFNLEYIIGGVGSIFRHSYIKKIGYYDTNTITEDIDLTMKILRAGNKRVKVMFASDVITQTPSVLSLKELVRQRYRWKWGRYQTFLKNSDMFFAKEKSFSKSFTWVYLPSVIFSELSFLLEPLIVTYIFAVSIYYGDFMTIISAYLTLSFYLLVNIFAENTETFSRKIKFAMKMPIMYFLFYILSFVEYFVLVKAILNLNNLKESLNINGHTWHPVKRVSGNFALDYSTESSNH